jgi:hypothetical protein
MSRAPNTEASAPQTLTAKQRLAVSRQLLCATASEPLWASLIRLYIRRSLKKLEAKKQPNPEASGRTPS